MPIRGISIAAFALSAAGMLSRSGFGSHDPVPIFVNRGNRLPPQKKKTGALKARRAKKRKK